jgi:hypothetical protein
MINRIIKQQPVAPRAILAAGALPTPYATDRDGCRPTYTCNERVAGSAAGSFPFAWNPPAASSGGVRIRSWLEAVG